MTYTPWQQEVRQYLIDQAATTGCTVDNLTTDRFPSSPLVCSCLLPYAGMKPLWTASKEKIGRPGLQVQVRDTDITRAYQTMKAIEQALVAASNTILGSTYYEAILPMQEAFGLGEQEDGSYKVCQNFSVIRNE